MMPELLREALLIANANYCDKTLSALPGTETDVRGLEAVLADPSIGGYNVETLLNESHHNLRRCIERFFTQATPNCLLLLYISGHGIKDRDGKLYFAVADTESDLLISTGLAATFIQEVSENSRCRRQVFIFDACFSGAFAKGFVHMSDQKAYVRESFSNATGKIIITASDKIQYAMMDDGIDGNVPTSVFTRHLVEGLRTGTAANDAEVITADRLYQYVYNRVSEDNPAQKPQLWSFGLSGDLVLARNPAQKRMKLTAELLELLEDPRPKVRLLGIDELEKLIVEPLLRPAIDSALKTLIDNDSKMVSQRAIEIQGKLLALRENDRERQSETGGEQQDKEIPGTETVSQPESPPQRLKGALVAAVAGAALGYFRHSLVGSRQDIFPVVIFVGAIFACSGWISGTRRRAIISSLAGLILGYIIFFLSSYESERYLSAIGFGAPLGALSGALFGEFIERRKARRLWRIFMRLVLIFLGFILIVFIGVFVLMKWSN
ncbi:MAG: caspase, EACC1-associated type [Methylobacter sp.]